MGIVAGFVERDHRHLYDALALCLPDGSIQIYRKRHLVFWERFRFRPGRSPLIVPTPWGRIGLAICADMIYRNVWDDYRGQIDLGVIASAWPEFACRHSGRKHWLFGHLGPLSAEIPVKVARDLGVPVICVNQCGATRTTIPMLGLRLTQQIDDRFAGRSSICDGRHTPPVIAGVEAQLVLSEVTVHNPRGLRSCRSMSPSVPAASSSRLGMIWTGVMGSLTYWWTNRRRPVIPVPRSLPHAIPVGQALNDRSGQRPSAPVERERVSHFSGLQAMTTDDATGGELERVRRACVDLGADEEMTELVLASHCHDRTLLDVMTAAGDDLRDYVRHKLAIWEAIFNEDEEPLRIGPDAARSGQRAATRRGTGLTDVRPCPAPSPT